MSDDLIRREDLIKKIFPYGMPDGGNYPINARAVMEAVMGVAAVEAEPVVHARWEWRDLIGDGCSLMLCCSNCLETRGARVTAKRCPDCGAHMDEEVAER